MTEKLQKAIEEELKKLPQEGQDAIGAVPWVTIVEEIGNKNGLNKEEIEDFQLETLLVLIGATDPEFYAINIENQANMTKKMSEALAEESFQKIFTPIRQALEDNIKNLIAKKDPDWQQTMDFILSGGDYFRFVTPTPKISTPEKEVAPDITRVPNTAQNIKDKFVI